MMADTIGQRLQKQRLARRLTLEQAAKATRIRLLYLQALENDDFTILPSPVQGRGFLRLYAQYLGLDVEALLDEMRQAAMQRPLEEEILLPETQPANEPPSVEKRLPLWEEFHQRLQTVLSQPVTGADEPVAVSSPKTGSPAADAPSETEPAPSQAESLPQSPADQPPVPVEPEEAKPALASSPPPGRLRRLFPPSQRLLEDHQETTPEASLPLQPSAEIFASLGAQLRERRQLLSLALEEIEQHIRVRCYFLQAIEDGRFDDFPSPVQARGMLSNYAAFLDMNVDEILLRFAEGLQAQHRERQPVAGGRGNGKKAKRAGIWRSFFAPDLVIGLMLVLSLFVFVIWAAGRILDRQQEAAREAEQAQAPSISDVLLSTPVAVESEVSPTPTLILEGVAAPVQTATPTPGVVLPTLLPLDMVQVTVNVLERTFMRVLVDGEVKFEGRPMPGTAYSFEGKDQVEIWSGSGAALQVIYNQKDQGRLGGVGEVVIRIYTRQAILTPTATLVPTATATLLPTATPVFSPTPIPAREGE